MRSLLRSKYGMYCIEQNGNRPYLLKVSSSPVFGNNGFRSNLKRLLFVDDEPNIRATLPTILRRYGFTVAVAGTVSQALDQIKNHAFGLLLCDLNIEREGDGYIVIRAMRAKNPDCVTM